MTLVIPDVVALVAPGGPTVAVPLGLDLAAVALGAVFGALLAVRRHLDVTGVGLGPVAAAAVGVTAATAGGVACDVLSGQRPYIFGPGPIYGLAAAAGSAAYVAVDRATGSAAAGVVVAIVVTVVLRLLAVHRGLSTRTAAEVRLGRGRRAAPSSPVATDRGDPAG